MLMLNSGLLLRATDDKLFGALVLLIFEGNVLHHSEDNGYLSQSGSLGTYVDPIQDVTV